MKKIVVLLSAVLMVAVADAQVRRKTSAPNATDSTGAKAAVKERKEIFKELNLSKQQKIKLREIKLADKNKISEIENDTRLSADEKKTKIKELKKAQLNQILTVLTDEQKATLKQLRKNKKQEKDNDEMMENL